MSPRPAWRTIAVAAGIAALAGSVAISPATDGTTRTIREQIAGSPVPGVPAPSQGTSAAPTTVVAPPDPRAACAPGRNGGATDTGVTATTIKLGATVVDSGIAKTFLRDARFGLLAAANKVNREGGICGRKLQLELVDDGWSFAQGGTYIRGLVEDKKVFALAVVPSSEGLKNVSDSGYLKRKKIPVVGSDGMLIHQYTDPYIWPVAASTVSAMHIMVKQAYDAGARRFGLVYEHSYHFGKEGAFAFNAAVKRVTGHDIDGYRDPRTNRTCEARFCGIAAGQGSYGTQIQTFNSACFAEPRCDFVALLLEPATALAWMTGGSITPSDGFRMGAPQPLFTRSFAEECRARCDKLWLWTSYDPPIGGNLGKPAVAEFVDELRVTSSSADPNNTFAEGAYIGMSLLAHALRQVGPTLTRERLIAVLNSTRFESNLTAPLTWRPGNHFANVRMQAFSIQFRDRFAGWRDERAEVADPWVGLDIPPPE